MNGIRSYEDRKVCGLYVKYWVDLFDGCHTSGAFGESIRLEWPDGGCYLEQYNITIIMFNKIQEQRTKLNTERAKRDARKKRSRI